MWALLGYCVFFFTKSTFFTVFPSNLTKQFSRHFPSISEKFSVVFAALFPPNYRSFFWFSRNLLQISCFHGIFVGNASFRVSIKKKKTSFFCGYLLHHIKKKHYRSCPLNLKKYRIYCRLIQKKHGFCGISGKIG